MRLSDYIAGYPEIDLSPLLGISKQEFDMLNRSPLYLYKNAKGAIVEFFIYISHRNSQQILQKLKRLSNNIIVFHPMEIRRLQSG